MTSSSKFTYLIVYTDLGNIMREAPDLSLPSVPDIQRDSVSTRQRKMSVEQGGTNLRETDFEWPESGPSGLPIEEKEQAKALGPFGAKVLASMTGAVVVSLLSKLLPFRTRPQLTNSDPLRCGQDSLTNCSAPLIQLSNSCSIRRLLSNISSLAAKTISKQPVDMHDISSGRIIDRKETTRPNVIFELTSGNNSSRAT